MSDDVTNEDRAGWAEEALMEFAAQVGILKDDGELGEEMITVIGDLFCNIRHYCHRNGLTDLMVERWVGSQEVFEEELYEEAEDQEGGV